jgi:hypothetical protein
MVPKFLCLLCRPPDLDSPVTLLAPPDVEQPPVRGNIPKLQDVITAANPNLSELNLENWKSSSPSTETSLLWTSMTTDGPTDRMYHRIDTGEAWPIRKPPRRFPVAKQADVGEILEDMQRRGFIEESGSPSSSPVVLVWKKNGERRFCVDYKKLNSVT